jgi:hypothetical protein
MATLDIQGIKVDCETTSYITAYKIEIHFTNSETDEDMLKSLEFRTDADSRSDLTFDQIEEIINEKVEEMDLEIDEISNIRVKEINTFKKSEYQDGEYYS